jgi:serine/threonine-protein kinase
MPTADDLCHSLSASGVLSAEQAAEVRRLVPAGDASPATVSAAASGLGWLTSYQAEQVAQGRTDDLAFGPYVLLERIGQGGMGQVFQARHRRLDRVVAL